MKYYHISAINKNFLLLYPRVPDNYMTKNNYENNTIKRISACNSIDFCLMGMSSNIKGKILYVYEAISNDINIISNKEIINNDYVPDAIITNEIWITSKCLFKQIYKIYIIDSYPEKYKYQYNDKFAYLYKWKFKYL